MSTIIEVPSTKIVPRTKNKAKQPKNSPQSTQATSAYSPRTALGQKLWLLRQRMIASGIPLLSRNELEDEIAERKGEREKG